MGRQVLALTVDRLSLIVDPCATCTYWERTPAQSVRPSSSAAETKRGWLTSVLLEWGIPGRIVLVDGTPAGYVTYAPAHLVPRAMAFPTAPVSEDAIVLVTARISAAYTGQGLGRVLVQSAVKDSLRRGFRAIEAFATASDHASVESDVVASGNGKDVGRGRNGATHGSAGSQGSGTHDAVAGDADGRRLWSPDHCLLPIGFFTAVGFYTVREHPAYPRMRLDLRTALGWREEVEQAVERLFSPVRSLGRRRPVGTVNRDTAPLPMGSAAEALHAQTPRAAISDPGLTAPFIHPLPRDSCCGSAAG